MTNPAAPAGARPPGDTDQSRVYLLVLLVEGLVIAALYLFGRAFS